MDDILIAINKKYKYLTFEEHNDTDKDFENWVMDEQFETHSIISIDEDIDKELLKFSQFDFDITDDTCSFNYGKYLKDIENKEREEQEYLEKTKQKEDLELALPAMLKAVQKLIRIDELTDDELKDMIYIYDDWNTSIGLTIPEGKLLRYEGVLYKALKEHEVKTEFNPEITNYLYVKAIPENVIPEWVKPTGYENVYNTGDKVLYNGKIYVSKIEGNSQEPTKDEPYNRYWAEE